MTKLRLASLTYAQLRAERSKLEYEIGEVSKFLKKCKRRKIKCNGFTIFIDDSSRTFIPREVILKELGPDWVRVHEKTTEFRSIRIVKDKK
jgi:hypothetical protein